MFLKEIVIFNEVCKIVVAKKGLIINSIMKLFHKSTSLILKDFNLIWNGLIYENPSN